MGSFNFYDPPTIGCFLLVIEDEIWLNTGLVLIALGNGMYLPVHIAEVGKRYIKRLSMLIIPGFVLYTASYNMGIFVGINISSWLTFGEMTNWFITAGVISFLSLLFIIITHDSSSETGVEDSPRYYRKESLSFSIMALSYLLFWITYSFIVELSFMVSADVSESFNNSFSLDVLGIDLLFSISFALIIFLLWKYMSWTASQMLLISGVLLLMVVSIIALMHYELLDSIIGPLMIVVLIGFAEPLASGSLISGILTKAPGKMNATIIAILLFIPTGMVSFYSPLSIEQWFMDLGRQTTIQILMTASAGFVLTSWYFRKTIDGERRLTPNEEDLLDQ